MRRSDREISEPEQIKAIIQSCDCCRLGFADQGGIYIVPLNFAFTEIGGERVFYFHSAKEGRKIDLIRANSSVGFELDTNHAVIPGEKACQYSFSFTSIIGTGAVTLVDDVSEKKKALELIMRHYSGRAAWAFTEDEVNSVAVIKMKASELSCKGRE